MGQNIGNDADRLVERLATEFGDDLVRFIARRVRTVADARDLAQEAYVRLLRLERKDLIRDPRPYLYRIAANILYEYQLKRKAEVVGLSRWSDETRHDVEAGYLEAMSSRWRCNAVSNRCWECSRQSAGPCSSCIVEKV
jgi:DNA-directed RNA polymerase specialized sigma24 family protein